MSAAVRTAWSLPKLTKWFFQATSLPVLVEPAFEAVEARRPIEVVLHVVLAVPHQLDRLCRPRWAI